MGTQTLFLLQLMTHSDLSTAYRRSGRLLMCKTSSCRM